MEKITEVLENDAVKLLILNSKEVFTENVKYASGINVIVGGNSLGRGITFPKLQTTYYCRVSKSPQADTMWQHARMFGYDRELDLMRVFIPPILYKLFSDINATNNSIITQIERKKPEDVNIHYTDNLHPTRKNVLDNNVVFTFTGGVDYFPFSPDNKSIEDIDTILSNDRALGKSITGFPVLTMYKVTGNKGWDGRKIWIPNIKLPETDVYYCI
jgi:hypothetical protein